jgi:hypothetical protein
VATAMEAPSRDGWNIWSPRGAKTFQSPAEEAAARGALRAQIARLEEQLAAQQAGSRARRPAAFAATLALPYPKPFGGAPEPRLLSLGELEAQRDELTERLREERAAADSAGQRHERARALREEALLDPAAHPHARISNDDVGEPGCHDLHVRPRFGLLGMLMRWWRVRISSGCP